MFDWIVAIVLTICGLFFWRVMAGVLGSAAWPWFLLALIPLAFVVARRIP